MKYFLWWIEHFQIHHNFSPILGFVRHTKAYCMLDKSLERLKTALNLAVTIAGMLDHRKEVSDKCQTQHS